MKPPRLTDDFVTSSGLVVTEGLGVVQISDQHGQVIDIPPKDAKELREWIVGRALSGGGKP